MFAKKYTKLTLLLMTTIIVSSFLIYDKNDNINYQNLKVINTDIIYHGNSRYKNFAWSEDGKYVVFSDETLSELYIMSMDSYEIKTLIEKSQNIGYFHFQWIGSHDIIYRYTRKIDDRTFQGLESINISTKAKKNIVETQSNLSTPHVDKKKSIHYFQADQLKIMPKSIVSKIFPSQNKVILRQKNYFLFRVNPSGEEVKLTSSEVFDPLLSLDENKVLYRQNGKIFVINNDGTEKLLIGNGSDSKWAFDGRAVVYASLKSDGHNYISSNIYLSTIDGKLNYQINQSEDIERYPAISPDGKKIIYSSNNNGRIYLTNIDYLE